MTELTPALSVTETATVLGDVVAPLLARGVLIRRPTVVGAVERFDLDRRAVRRLQHLDRDHGPGPVRMVLPGRQFAVVLDPDDAHRVLDDQAGAFAAATPEKRAALSPFQPHGVLASRGPARADRRRFNEQVLDSSSPVHELVDALHPRIVEEAQGVAASARARGVLTWDDVVVGWYRMVRRVVLGDAARDDHAVTDLLADLRSSGNWSVLHRRHGRTRARFLRQLEGHLDRAEPGSLARLVADTPATDTTRPVEQLPQWLFAFDAAAWTLVRTLALVTSDPTVSRQAVRDVEATDLSHPHELPLLRASVLDTLRLYPTTPAILRETTADTTWANGRLPADTGVLVYAPFFHRDDRRVDAADRFAPDLWQDDGAVRSPESMADAHGFLPFSAGPGICPGRHVVLLTVSTTLAVLLRELDLTPVRGPLRTDRLPSALSPFHLQFRVRARP